MDVRLQTTAPGRPRLRARAFSLLELLMVVAIIGILAALLLPAVERGRFEAKRISCVHDLQQIGVTFHSFAHDHNGQFPMQVPANSGGSSELARNSYQAASEFYFGFRHLQALSNELVTPKLLVCPSDTRLPAANWRVLNNRNLSYCVGINADLSRPGSILAADRNLTNDWATPRTLQRLGPKDHLRWTHELHRFRGDVLFADGHVEQWNSPGLTAARGRLTETADLVLPSTGGGTEPIIVAGGTGNWHPSQSLTRNAQPPSQALPNRLVTAPEKYQARAEEPFERTNRQAQPPLSQTAPESLAFSATRAGRVASSVSQDKTVQYNPKQVGPETNALSRDSSVPPAPGAQIHTSPRNESSASTVDMLKQSHWAVCLALLALVAVVLWLRKKQLTSPKRSQLLLSKRR